jgi:hypothetical protein
MFVLVFTLFAVNSCKYAKNNSAQHPGNSENGFQNKDSVVTDSIPALVKPTP